MLPASSLSHLTTTQIPFLHNSKMADLSNFEGFLEIVFNICVCVQCFLVNAGGQAESARNKQITGVNYVTELGRISLNWAKLAYFVVRL